MRRLPKFLPTCNGGFDVRFRHHRFHASYDNDGRVYLCHHTPATRIAGLPASAHRYVFGCTGGGSTHFSEMEHAKAAVLASCEAIEKLAATRAA